MEAVWEAAKVRGPMKGCCDAHAWGAGEVEVPETLGEEGRSGSELVGWMAGERRRGAPLAAWAMSEEERVEAAAVLVKRP